MGPSRALGTFEAWGTWEALGQGPAVRQPRSLTLLGPLACPTCAPRQLRERALARAGPLHPAAPRTALPSPCWLMPPQGSAFKELPTHTSHPPGSGPPSLAHSLSPASQRCIQDPAPLPGHRHQALVPPGPETPPRSWGTPVLLSCWGAGGSPGALVPLRPAHLAPGASTAQTSVTGTRKETLWRWGSPLLAGGPRCLVQPPGGTGTERLLNATGCLRGAGGTGGAAARGQVWRGRRWPWCLQDSSRKGQGWG